MKLAGNIDILRFQILVLSQEILVLSHEILVLSHEILAHDILVGQQQILKLVFFLIRRITLLIIENLLLDVVQSGKLTFHFDSEVVTGVLILLIGVFEFLEVVFKVVLTFLLFFDVQILVEVLLLPERLGLPLLFELLDAITVSQGVQGVFAAALDQIRHYLCTQVRTYVADHERFAVSGERVL